MPVFVPSGKKLTTTKGRFVPSQAKAVRKPRNFSEAVAYAKAHPGSVKHHGGWANPLTSAFHEATAMATGLPAGIVGIGTAAKNSAENAVQGMTSGLGRHAPARKKHSMTLADLAAAVEADYRYRWGPLAHGHPGEFAKRFTHTPLSDIFDILTVLSAGAGAAGKISPALRAADKLRLTTPSGEVLERPLRGTNLGRALKHGADRSLRKIVPNESRKGVPRRGPTEWNRAAKLERKRAIVEDMRRKVAVSPYLQAAEKLDTSVPFVPRFRGANKQLIASNLRAELVDSKHVEMYAERIRKWADAVEERAPAYARAARKEADTITHPSVLNWVDNPTKKMLRKEALGEGVVQYREESVLPIDASSGQRPWQSLLMLHGAEFKHAPLEHEPRVGMDVTHNGYHKKITKIEGDEATIESWATNKHSGKKYLHKSTVPVSELRSTRRELTGPAPIEDMIAEIRAQLPEGREPTYQPHEMGTRPAPSSQGAGGSVPQRSPVHQNLGKLFDAGLIAFNRDLLGRGTQRLLRWAHYSDKHDMLVRGGVFSEHIHPGWQPVKQKLGESLSHTEQNITDFNQMLDSISPDEIDNLANEFVSDAKRAESGLDEVVKDEAGRYLIVPEGYAKRIIGSFSRSDSDIAKFFHNVTAVWRALVLNLRPAWLVNNIVGNTLLYSVQHTGKNGLRAYLSAVLESGMGPDTLLSKILGREFTARIPAKELAEILPDEVLATFMGTQMPEGRLLAHTIGHRYSPARWARNLDQNYEKALRKAIADRVLSNNPRVRAIHDAMPEQSRSWMEAVKQAVKEDKLLPERVSGEINAALGDFTSMTAFERGVLRSVVPFYAWYRAITLVVLKMPLDSPYRTAALAKLGQIGQETTDQWWREHGVDPESLPFHLRSVLPWGNSAYRMTGLNPFTTTPQLLGGFMVAGSGQDILGSLNPVFFAPLIAAVKGAYPAPWEKKRSFIENAAWGGLDFLRFLPETRLAYPYDSKSAVGKGSRGKELASYLGWSKFRPDFAAIAKRYNGR